jgi:hypothetical protein
MATADTHVSEGLEELSTSLPGRRYGHLLFSAMAVLILATLLAGFAPSYYCAGIFRAPQPSTIIHAHGAVFSCWILLLITQTSLVSAGRISNAVDLARRRWQEGTEYLRERKTMRDALIRASPAKYTAIERHPTSPLDSLTCRCMIVRSMRSAQVHVLCFTPPANRSSDSLPCSCVCPASLFRAGPTDRPFGERDYAGLAYCG